MQKNLDDSREDFLDQCSKCLTSDAVKRKTVQVRSWPLSRVSYSGGGGGGGGNIPLPPTLIFYIFLNPGGTNSPSNMLSSCSIMDIVTTSVHKYLEFFNQCYKPR